MTQKKQSKVKGWVVYSMWGFHAFYKDESTARKHWKNSRKYRIEYQIFPLTITYQLPAKTK